MQITRRALLESAAATAVAASTPALAAGAGSADAALKTLFDHMCERLLAETPEGATYLGLDTGKRAALHSRLGDRSWASIETSRKESVAWLAKLEAIPSARLSEAGLLNKDTVAYALQLGRDSQPFAFGENTMQSAMNEASTPYVVSQQSGNFVGVPEFLDSQHKIETKVDADAYLARLEAFATTLDQETDRVKHDIGIGVCPPDFLLKTATGQMKRFLAVPVALSRLVTSIAARTKARNIKGDYAARAAKLTTGKVYPAIRRQLDTLTAAQATATHDAGVWKFKDGEAYYAWCLRAGTTTDQTAEEIHQTGLRQNAEIIARMDGLLKKQGLSTGTVSERMQALGKNPRFTFPDNDAGRQQILDYLNKLIAEAHAAMPKASHLTLKAPVRVKRVPPDIQDGAGLGYMNTGSLDGSRPSTYYINLKSTANWPKFSLPTLTHHEAIPGHAWQGAYLTETGKLPLIRIMLSGFNAYVEGWALYSEQLSDELGLYDNDPFGQLGYLQAQQFRAVRLVVDTGLHAKQWSREKAVQWAVEQTGRTEAAMTSEIDRYCGTPGQACGYKVGHNELIRLRDKAKAALGAKFDLRDYDDWVVEAGAVPIAVLSAVIDRHVAEKMKA